MPTSRTVAVVVLSIALDAVLASASSVRTSFTVKYRSATNVYLDGGRAEGLRERDRLSVNEGSTTVAEIEVVFVSEHSASCRVVSEKRAIRPGDLAFASAPRPEPTLTTAAVAAPAKQPEPPGAVAPSGAAPSATKKKVDRPWARARGAISFGYYHVFDESASNMDYAEKTARVDVTLSELGGGPASVTARFRSRQDDRLRGLTTVNPQSNTTTRLYELALRYEPEADNVGFEVGRIGVSRYVGLGYLDGALGRVRLGGSPAQVGGFFGRTADADGLGIFGGAGQKYGGFLRLAAPGRFSGSYESIVAFVRELDPTRLNRQYLSVESRLGSGQRFLFFERAELDLNRGAPQQTAATSAIALTNVSLSANVRFGTASYALVSYDARKLPQLLTPTTPSLLPLDALQQGLRGNVTLGSRGGLSVNGGVGMRFQQGDARSSLFWNGGVYHPQLIGLSFGADVTQFSNGITDGILILARTGKRFRAGHGLDFSYGNSRYRVAATGENRSSQWFRFSVNGELGRGLYLLGDSEYYRGDDQKGPKGLFEVGYRF